MRVSYVVLLAAALLSSVEAVSTERNNLNVESLVRKLGTDPNAIPSKRLLRAHTTTSEEDDEERGIFSTGWVDDLFQNNQLKNWLKQDKSADDAFALLKVDKVTDNLLDSPEWKAWAKYVTMLNKNDADESIVGALSYRLGADKVSEMLASAAKNPASKDIATKLEAAQVKRWANSLGTPDDIFKLLKLDKVADGVFDSPQLATYTSYLKAFNAKNPATKTSVLETFTKKYGEEGLLKMLVTGQNAKSAGATKLKDEMVQSWLEFTTPPANVFKTLKLDQAGDELLSSPLLSTWVQYMKAFNKVVPRKETSMIETFTKNYGEKKLATMLRAAKKVPSPEKLATNLQRAQFKQWMVEKKSPDDIYKTVLKLDSTSDASADIWRAYYKAYDKEFPGQLFSFNL